MHEASRKVSIPTLQVKNVRKPARADGLKFAYSFDEVFDFYNRAKNFGEAFKNVVSKYVDLGSRWG